MEHIKPESAKDSIIRRWDSDDKEFLVDGSLLRFLANSNQKFNFHFHPDQVT